MFPVVAVVAAAVFMPSAAYADKWVSTDEHQDVAGYHYSPDPAPCGTVVDVDGTADTNDDITGLTVRHAAHTVWLKARFRDLDATKEQSVSFHLATPDKKWEIDVERFQKPSGDFRVFGFFAELPDDAGRADCTGTTEVLVSDMGSGCGIHPALDFDADVVRAHIARKCLENPAWVRVGLDAQGWVEPEDPADTSFTGYTDYWQAMDAFGPKVRTGAAK